MNYAEYIRALRSKRGLTQKQLAEAVGVATGTIQQYELGKRQPRDSILERIAEVCDAPKPSLIFGKPESFDTAAEFEKRRAEIMTESKKADAEERERLEQLTANFRKLNARGQQVAVERTAELTQLPQFTEGCQVSISIDHSPERDVVHDNATGKTVVTRKDDE